MTDLESWFHVGNDWRELAIYVNGEIPADADDFFSVLNSIPTPEQVNLYMNCLGGSVFGGFAVANKIGDLRRAGAKVTCHVEGIIGSAATLIAAAADEVILQQDGFFMLHGAEYPDGREADARSAEMTDLMARRLARKAGRPVDQVLELLAAGECWMSAREAVAAGFADVVVAG